MKNTKVDVGPELIYWNLSYRRKFIRTLKTIPFCAILLLFPWLVGGGNFTFKIVISLVVVVSIISELIYTYLKWKKTE